MKRLSRLTFFFGLLFAVLILSPAFLSQQFGPYSLMKNGDVLDLLTPLVLLPFYWLLLQMIPGQLPKQSEMIIFMVLAGAWAMGQGMHLSANSIGHLVPEGNDIYRLTYFYDEELSHFIWHGAIIGMSALLLFRQWKNPLIENDPGWIWLIAGGIFYGFTYAAAILEGGTALLGVPFAVLAVIFILVWMRPQLRRQPLGIFFFVSYGLAALLFAIWALIWGGLPEPCSVIGC